MKITIEIEGMGTWESVGLPTPKSTPPKVCEVEGCEKPYFAKGLCKKHYKAAWYAANSEKVKTIHAAWCAANPEKVKAINAGWYAANSEKVKAWHAVWYASHSDEVKARSAAWAAANPEKVKVRNAAWYAANSEKVKASVAAWDAANPERVRARTARKRARKLGNITEAYSRLDVFERDAWVCQLCLLPVDPVLVYPNPGSASLDHIVPLVLGGSDTEDNVVAAHLVCNLKKGGRLEPLPDDVVWTPTEFDPALPTITIEL